MGVVDDGCYQRCLETISLLGQVQLPEACAGKVHEGLLGFGPSIVRAWVVSVVCKDGRDRRLRSALSSARGDGKVEGSQLYVTAVEPLLPSLGDTVLQYVPEGAGKTQ